MIRWNDCLFEILTEELPPKNLLSLSQALGAAIEQGLKQAGLKYKNVQLFATPRRLAVLIFDLSDQQPEQYIERLGPAVATAFDQDDKPTESCVGFAKSCGVDLRQLKQKETPKGTYLVFSQYVPGKTVFELMPVIVRYALHHLPIRKKMRWGDHAMSFVRPIHSVMLLYGNCVISGEIFEKIIGNTTRGHRFHCQKDLVIKKPSDYAMILKKKGFVLANFNDRKEVIRQQILKLAQLHHVQVSCSEELLEEVTSIVEWPNALFARFDPTFLSVPKEVLMSCIQVHQRSFPVLNEEGNPEPYFITVSNLESRNPQKIVDGNERVMKARLSDAKFFYENDLKTTLKSRVIGLKKVVFQMKLGSLFDKTQRILRLANWIARSIKANVEAAERAALLSKTDLLTNMVNEFPELQGIMGKYYALYDGELSTVAIALSEQYMPHYSGDALPCTKEGQALAIADRIDTIVGVFGINKKPTGDKDPFGLRRAAIGIIRIILESRPPLSVDILKLIEQAHSFYSPLVLHSHTTQQVYEFIYDRLKAYLIECGFALDEINAVSANTVCYLDDFIERLQAVQEFRILKESISLANANKRVVHLLAKNATILLNKKINFDLLQHPAEIQLARLITEKLDTSQKLLQARRYTEFLKNLAALSEPIDQFFDQVMVMVEEVPLRNNRLVILAQLRRLFLQVADISLLQL